MKINAIDTAKAIWLLPTNEFNPRGLNLNHGINDIVERYSFASFTRTEELYGDDNPSPKFMGGSYAVDEEEAIEVSITIHNDGIVADSKASTELTEKFLVDFMTWMAKKFGTMDPSKLSIKKVYVSEISFSLKKVPSFFSNEVDALSKNASNLTNDRGMGPFRFKGLTLETDPASSKNPLNIKIERKVDTPHNANRYYSAAPLQTSAHISLIEKFEKLF